MVDLEALENRFKNTNNTVPIWRKVTMTLEEASEYSNIGINKLREISNDHMCDFVLFVGKKRLIKRKEFEEFLSNHSIL